MAVSKSIQNQFFSTPTATEVDTRLSSTRMFWLFMTFVALLLGFFTIDHSPFASSHFAPEAEFIDSENRTADRVEAVNLLTAPVRLFLGLAGFVFLLIPTQQRLHWGGVTIVCFGLYVAYMSASFGWSINPKVTAQKCMVLACFGFAAVGLARQFTMPQLNLVFVIVCLAYIGLGLAAEIVLGNFTPHKSDYRFVGTCHPNTLAVYGSFCCLSATAYFGIVKRYNPWLVLIFVVGFTTLLATKSRTTLAAFTACILAVPFLTLQRHIRILAISLTLLAITFGGLALTLSRSNVRMAAGESIAMGRTKDVSSLTGRLPLWEELLKSIGDRPITGHGYLAFWQKEKIDYLSATLKWEIPHGHNMYLDVLLDGGAIGLGLFILMLLVPLVISFRRSVRDREKPITVVFGLLLFALIHGSAESLFKLPTFLSFMLVTLALRMAFTPKAVQTDNGLLRSTGGQA